MGFISDISRLMKVATKPDRKELWLIIRVTLLGMGLLGLLGFIIKIASGNILNIKASSSTTLPFGVVVFFIVQPIFALIPHLI